MAGKYVVFFIRAAAPPPHLQPWALHFFGDFIMHILWTDYDISTVQYIGSPRLCGTFVLCNGVFGYIFFIRVMYYVIGAISIINNSVLFVVSRRKTIRRGENVAGGTASDF